MEKREVKKVQTVAKIVYSGSRMKHGIFSQGIMDWDQNFSLQTVNMDTVLFQ